MSKSDASAHRVPPYKRPLVVGGLLLILAIVGIITVLICKNFLGRPTQDDSTHLSNQTSSNNEVNPPEPTTPTADQDLENKAPQYEGEDPNQLDELTGVIAYADIDTSSQVLHSAITINQYLQTGQCVFNLKRGDAIYRSASSAIVAEATTSVCGPFSLSIDGISSGTYQIEVIMTTDGKRGVITEELQI